MTAIVRVALRHRPNPLPSSLPPKPASIRPPPPSNGAGGTLLGRRHRPLDKVMSSAAGYSSASGGSPPGDAVGTWPKVTLYGDLNMRPFRNAWMLEEIGLPYEHVNCRPWSRRAKGVHPMGKGEHGVLLSRGPSLRKCKSYTVRAHTRPPRRAF